MGLAFTGAGATKGGLTQELAPMTVNLFTFVDLFDRHLATANHLLAKGLDHAGANVIPEAEMLDWRLIDDMQPLRFQIMVVINFAQQWPARVAGLDVPESIQTDLDAPAWPPPLGTLAPIWPA